MVTTITRAQVMAIYEHIISEVPELTYEERDGLREAALTAPRIAGGAQWWDAEAECGCLVGTWLHRHVLGGALGNAGTAYIYAMDEVLGPDVAQVLTVTQ